MNAPNDEARGPESKATRCAARAGRPEEDHEHVIELLERVAKRDRQAFRQLYDETSSFVFGVVRTVLRQRDWAEEATQDVYVTIWSKASDFDPKRGRPHAWLATLARNRAIDRLRRERSNGLAELRVEPADEFEPLASGELSVESVIVRRALAALKTEYRQALLLAYFQGCSHSELAAALDIPLGTAKSRVKRGLAQLREAVG